MHLQAHLPKVVITGLGAVSPYGVGVGALKKGLYEGLNCIHRVEELEKLDLIKTKVAATVKEIDYSSIPRQRRRSMSRMAVYAYYAAQEALAQAGYTQAPKGLGFFMGSTLNSISVWMDICNQCLGGHAELVKTSSFLQIMNHSPQAVVGQALKIDGPSFAGAAACATGLLNIGLAAGAIQSGLASQVLCGGTEEYHPMFSACFDIMQATSHNFNDRPELSCRPFDAERTGLVCSEGCGLLFLEREDVALARGAQILGEVVSFASNTETQNIANPSAQTMQDCMQCALEKAGLTPADIDFVNAHATATLAGDAAESAAVNQVFGPSVKVNSFKGHLGHTMGAAGALELIACLQMMQDGVVLPTKNLQTPAQDCAPLNYVRQKENFKIHTLLKNSFAIGGNNCSLIVRR